MVSIYFEQLATERCTSDRSLSCFLGKQSLWSPEVWLKSWNLKKFHTIRSETWWIFWLNTWKHKDKTTSSIQFSIYSLYTMLDALSKRTCPARPSYLQSRNTLYPKGKLLDLQFVTGHLLIWATVCHYERLSNGFIRNLHSSPKSWLCKQSQ